MTISKWKRIRRYAKTATNYSPPTSSTFTKPTAVATSASAPSVPAWSTSTNKRTTKYHPHHPERVSRQQTLPLLPRTPLPTITHQPPPHLPPTPSRMQVLPKYLPLRHITEARGGVWCPDEAVRAVPKVGDAEGRTGTHGHLPTQPRNASQRVALGTPYAAAEQSSPRKTQQQRQRQKIRTTGTLPSTTAPQTPPGTHNHRTRTHQPTGRPRTHIRAPRPAARKGTQDEVSSLYCINFI